MHLSAPDQYTIVPFPNKCIKLLVDDFIHTLNERVPNEVKGDELTEITESDDDAEEWEDDQIDELKGYSSEFNSFAKFGSKMVLMNTTAIRIFKTIRFIILT